MCRELVGIDDTDPLFHKLITGFDNKVLQVDKRIWEFSQQAAKHGAGRRLPAERAQRTSPPTSKRAAEGPGVHGRVSCVPDEDGWRMQRMSEINLPIWIEDPAPPLTNLKQFLVKGGGFNLEEERARSAGSGKRPKRRCSRIEPQQKSWFTTLLRLAQKCGSFSEEHDHYLDLYTHAMMRRSCLGDRHGGSPAAGAIDSAEDMFFLIPDEIRKAAINPDQFNLRPIVARRRAEWQKWCEKPNPPVDPAGTASTWNRRWPRS